MGGVHSEVSQIDDLGKLVIDLSKEIIKFPYKGFVEQVEGLYLERKGKKIDILDGIPDRWEILSGGLCFEVYAATGHLFIPERASDFDMKDVISLYHEKGHIMDFEKKMDDGIDVTIPTRRCRYVNDDVLLENINDFVGYELTAWEYAIGEMKNLGIKKKYFSSLNEHIESCLDNYHNFCEGKTEFGKTDLFALASGIEGFNVKKEKKKYRKRYSDWKKKWL